MSIIIRILYTIIALNNLYSRHVDGPFCLEDKNSGHFPISPPDRHLPWIWDATLSNDRSFVEITTISRNACKFNNAQWKKLVRDYPQYADQLGNGLDSNILVDVDKDYDYARDNNGIPGLIWNYVTCIFYLNENVVYKIASYRINGDGMTASSSIQIRCPLPPQKQQGGEELEWNYIQIERPPPSLTNINSNIMSNEKEKISISPITNKTSKVSVCPSIDNSSSVSNKRYTLTICTATARQSREKLVEWIEYHLLLGIEHFYLYNTSPRSKQNKLPEVLKDYIKEKIVTIIPWPYSNCVLGMGGGRMIHARNIGSFLPPKAIAQTAALASCYSRFKATTDWMAHIDDDEFFAIDTNSLGLWNQKFTSLTQLVKLIEKNQPTTPAIYFQPISVMTCPPEATSGNDTNKNSTSDWRKDDANYRIAGSTRGRHKTSTSNILPRFGRVHTARLAHPYEGKLIMRTEAVGMFYIHYLTYLESIGELSLL